MNMKKLLSICLLFVATTLSAGAQSFELLSPDSSYKVELFNTNGESKYRISYNDKVVVLDSDLGVQVNNL